MNVTEAVMSRRSIRSFTEQPVDPEVLRRVLDKARWAPSGCNYQPWEAHVVTGELLKQLQGAMLASEMQNPIEYSFSEPDKSPQHKARLQAVGAKMYGALQIAREDTQSRGDFSRQNIVSFGAPVLLLNYIRRSFGPPQWSDVGMWLQTIMLLLREEGLDSCPQEWMSLYAKVLKAEIGISDEDYILFTGLAIGYRTEDDPVNTWERDRAPLDEQITWLGF
ncbi:MAG: nitroreductase [Alphaproteobacteria bacterium]|nr:nitroreductase [Alphaproteobacteria bacterium]